MQTWVIFVGLIAVTAVIMLIVGFIGNKVVDKTENSFRSRRVDREYSNPVRTERTESLADRLNRSGYRQAPRVHRAAFCNCCGEKLGSDSRFCTKCGAMVETYEK